MSRYEANHKTNSVLEKETIPSSAFYQRVPATQSQNNNMTQQEELIHDTKTIMEISLIQEHESLGLTDSILDAEGVHPQDSLSQFEILISSLEPSRRCHNNYESLDAIDEDMCKELIMNEDEQPLKCVDEESSCDEKSSEEAVTILVADPQILNTFLGICESNKVDNSLVPNDRQRGAVCDAESNKLLSFEAGAKKGGNNFLGGKITLVLARKKCMLSKVSGITCDLECDQVKFNDNEEFVGYIEFNEWRLARDFLLMNSGIFMNPQPLHDKGITGVLLVEAVGTEKKLSSRLSRANYVWKPGGLFCAQDHWNWIVKAWFKIQVCSGFDLEPWIGLETYGWKYKKQVPEIIILAETDETITKTDSCQAHILQDITGVTKTKQELSNWLVAEHVKRDAHESFWFKRISL